MEHVKDEARFKSRDFSKAVISSAKVHSPLGFFLRFPGLMFVFKIFLHI